MKSYWRAVAVVVGVLAVLLVARGALSAYRFEVGLAFIPRSLGNARADSVGLTRAVDVVYGQSDGAPLHGWYVPATGKATIVFVHGAGGDRRSLAREAELLSADGFGALLLDLPGQGASGGRITCGRNEEAAVEAAVEWSSRQGEGRLIGVGALGISLGSQFVARVAAVDPRIRAVVLEAASTSIIDRIRASHPQFWGLTVYPASLAFFRAGTNPWHNPASAAVSAIAPRPLLLIAGAHDPLATPAMARELLSRAGPEAQLEMFETGHGRYWEADSARYAKLLRAFFANALKPR